MTINIDLKWTLDFTRGVIVGSVTHTMKVVKEGTTHAKFDSSKCHVSKVLINTHEAVYDDSKFSKELGTCISVELPPPLRRAGAEFDVCFEYETDKDASAVQWLAPEATSSGKFPFVFTQCQAIHARSLMPCQDSPGVKAPYSATVTAPAWCVVLMSALQQGDPVPSGSSMIYKWSQPVPCCSYLVALAAGELESRKISDRVKVWAEPGVVDAAAFEFSETESFLTTAEELTLPYAWTRYDVLCLPPSFPYGGMENPCLTFATPTLLAGDKSLAAVIAHEIAHSWTGNLVTNCTWEHFWLNEGWTVWLERKIMSRVKKDINHLKMSSQLGWTALQGDLARYTGESSRFTQLVWPLSGEDPDEAFSRVPYEKGFNFLFHLEGLVGTEPFEAFAKQYLQEFKYSTVSSGEFKDFFMSKFSSVPAVAALDWDAFFYGQGMPPINVDFSNSLQDVAEALAKKWIGINSSGSPATGMGPKDIAGWDSQQTCIFLGDLLSYAKKSQPLTLQTLRGLNQAYAFTSVVNSEIKFCWQMLCLMSEDKEILPHVVAFATSQGRMKFVRPLYKALYESAIGSTVARDTFIANSGMYHPICRKMLASDLSIDLDTLKANTNATALNEGSSCSASQVSETNYFPIVAAVLGGAAIVAFHMMKKP